MDEFKKVVAGNITRLRTSMNLTQAQLGEMLNYSDKSISKWERGESIPDVFVLKKIADLVLVHGHPKHLVTIGKGQHRQ